MDQRTPEPPFPDACPPTGKAGDMAADVKHPEDRARSACSCMESADAWRQNARYVRERAARPQLNPQTRAALLREADASDRQAEWWKAEAEDGRY